jgi:predicted metalloprotease
MRLSRSLARIGQPPAVTFRSGAQLDPSQVDDARGRSGGFGGMGGRGVVVGGGGIGTLLLLVLIYALGGNLSSAAPGLGGTTIGDPNATSDPALAQNCKTGADANAREDCRIVGYVNSVQQYWTGEFTAQGQSYVPARTTFFTGQIQTGCGTATTDVGPFYCPTDKRIWIDLGFFDELQSRFGARGGSLAEGYVIAHEYGHHVQDLVGVLDQGSAEEGAQGRSVRVELQADCYAGVWAANAVKTDYLEPLTDAQISDALDAAQAVGDDRIQQETQGRITPDTWTHGSAAQRQKWFSTGYGAANPDACDTFNGAI